MPKQRGIGKSILRLATLVGKAVCIPGAFVHRGLRYSEICFKCGLSWTAPPSLSFGTLIRIMPVSPFIVATALAFTTFALALAACAFTSGEHVASVFGELMGQVHK